MTDPDRPQCVNIWGHFGLTQSVQRFGHGVDEGDRGDFPGSIRTCFSFPSEYVAAMAPVTSGPVGTGGMSGGYNELSTFKVKNVWSYSSTV